MTLAGGGAGRSSRRALAADRGMGPVVAAGRGGRDDDERRVVRPRGGGCSRRCRRRRVVGWRGRRRERDGCARSSAVGAVGEAVGLVLDDRDYEGGSGVRFNVNITYLAADRGDLVYRKNFDLCLARGA